MKFDMNMAWNEAVKMIRANREVLAIVAGLFFFIPAVVMALALPDVEQPPMGSDADVDVVMEMIAASYAENWWILLLGSLVQVVGTISLLALLRDTARPTVGEAIKTGAIGLIPYILAYLIVVLALSLIATVLIVGLSLVSTVLGALGALVFLVLMVYAMVKFSLIAPVIAIEKVLNPFTAVQRSWRLTKGNSVRLFLFYLLLIIVYVVIATIFGVIFGLIATAFGSGSVSVGIQAVLGGLLGAAAQTVGIGIMAAVHQQLAGPSPERVGETFE